MTLSSLSFAEQINKAEWETMAGINFGASIGRYGIGANGFFASTKVGDTNVKICSTTSVSKTKVLPIIEVELSSQYLINKVFVGISTGGV